MESNETTVTKSGKNTKLLIIGAVVVVMAMIAAIMFTVLKDPMAYSKATKMMEKENYAEAMEILKDLDYKKSDEFYVECQYKYGIQLFEDGKNFEAMNMLQEVRDIYLDAEEYIYQASLNEKYSHYDQENSEFTPDELETLFYEGNEVGGAYSEGTHYYRRYYNHDYDSYSNPDVKEYIDFYSNELDGKFFYITNARYLWDVPSQLTSIGIDGFFADDPDTPVSMTLLGYTFVNEPNFEMLLNYDENSYYSMDYETYAYLESLQPIFSNDEIIQATFNLFKTRAKNAYQTGTASDFYHNCTYSNASVSYDYDTQIYTCTMRGSYNTNVFNFFGTNTRTYNVTAYFGNYGSSPTVIDYSIK